MATARSRSFVTSSGRLRLHNTANEKEKYTENCRAGQTRTFLHPRVPDASVSDPDLDPDWIRIQGQEK